MTTFTYLNNVGQQNMDMLLNSLQMANITAISPSNPSSTQMLLSTGLQVNVQGTGLAYTGSIGNLVFTGQVTLVTFRSGVSDFAQLTLDNSAFSGLFDSTLELFNGDDDLISSGAFPQAISGYGGADTLQSTDGIMGQDADSLYGGTGDDVITVNLSTNYDATIGLNDAIFGGDGTDTLQINLNSANQDISVMPQAPQGIEAVAIRLGSLPGSITLTNGASVLTAPGVTQINDLQTITATAATTIDLSGLTWSGMTFGPGSYSYVAFNGSIFADNFTAADTYINTAFQTYTGGDGDDTLTGGASDENLFGGAGLNVLNGGGGFDTVNGGDNAETLSGGAGTDYVYGGFGNDSASGGDGADTMNGGADDDTVSGGNDADVINGGDNADSLSGDAGDDTLTGDDGLPDEDHGNDTLNGGAGADTMQGGGGNDTYIADAQDTIIELNGTAEGRDTLQRSISTSLLAFQNIENLTLTGSAAIDGTGDAGDNVITGNAATNSLIGGGGLDTLAGGAGDDIYTVGAGVTVIEGVGAGADTALTRVTHALATNVEYLTLLGSAAANLTGNALANRITGNDAANRIDGGLLADTLIGFGGDDTYVFGTGDVVVEFAGGGTDTVQSDVTVTLAENVERLVLTGSLAAAGTGNTAANSITGNTAANILNGGAGNDTLTGGAGADAFVFNTALATTNIDRITDFNHVADTIRLENAIFTGLGVATGALNMNAFWANTTGLAHDTSDRIIYETDTGILRYDSNGSANGGTIIQFAVLTLPAVVDFTDFAVI